MALSREDVGPKILAKIKIYPLTRAYFVHFAMRYPVILIIDKSVQNISIMRTLNFLWEKKI